MSASKTKHVIVFKTGKLYELDMATEALKENNIPFYRQSESSSGLRFARMKKWGQIFIRDNW